MATLIVGDIHGCYDEFETLLARAGLADDDSIIALGDLLDRGPQPGKVLTFFLSYENARSIRGNHEQYHLDAKYADQPPGLAQLITRFLLGDAYADSLIFMESLPLFLELPDVLLFHAYLEPGIAPEQQQPSVLLGMDEGEKYLKSHFDRPWFDLYTGEKPIIAGHRDYTQMQKPFVHNKFIGLDTRCVYGGSLTGLLLPAWRFISVKARDNHWQTLRGRYGL